jgi:hypothetical protein
MVDYNIPNKTLHRIMKKGKCDGSCNDYSKGKVTASFLIEALRAEQAVD